jgi:glycosyltransferase involved in cell wall biosynthesis
MKILQLNTTDLLGSRFNGRDLNIFFRKLGHDAQQCVWFKEGNDHFTWRLSQKLYRGFFYKVRDLLNHLITLIEGKLSIQSLLYPWPIQLLYDKRFLTSDIVHYHLLHNGYFSLHAMPKLTALKPSIWTIHDPWLMTGHCVYPYSCERWKDGCGECPDLKTFMPMRFDNTRYMFVNKKNILGKSRVDIVVASKFMLDMAQKSPIFASHRIHYIPFGVDLSIFKQMDSIGLRNKYNIGLNNLVISFRQTDYEYKGLIYIKEALRKIVLDEYSAAITLITVNQKGLLEEFKDEFQIIELGIVTDEAVMAEFYNCSDMFLMPSTAEAFGMMAIEAMACGIPVIVFEGTSLPEVIFSPAGGISVPMMDSDALYAAIDLLLKNPNERNAIGDEAYRLSRIHYDFNDHAEKILALYEDVLSRRKSQDNE